VADEVLTTEPDWVEVPRRSRPARRSAPRPPVRRGERPLLPRLLLAAPPASRHAPLPEPWKDEGKGRPQRQGACPEASSGGRWNSGPSDKGPTFPPKPWNPALRRPMMAGLEWVRFQPGRPGPPAAGGAIGRRTEAFFAGEVLRHAGGVGVISGVSVPGQGESGAATSSLRASRHLEALLYNESNLPGAGRGKGGLPYIPVRPLVVPK